MSARFCCHLSATLSHTLERTGRREIGLLLLACSLSPSFRMGITSAIFQALGKILLTNELFMMEVIHGAITGRQSLITRIGTLSIPGALLSGIDFTIYSTIRTFHRFKGKLIRLGVTGWDKW